MPLSAGNKLGPYEILAPIGAGGMGEVYKARDGRLKRDVAIKVLPAALARNPERMARFEREARLLASLDHPNIGALYGLEESGGMRALVLALIEGPTLADRIAAGPVPPEEAIPIAQQMAEALEYAHDRGVIHRDLKPANVKITPEGIVKVLDFGLAKALTGEGDAAPAVPAGSAALSPTLTLGATEAGMILGTAAYMAPEQAKGKTVDRRADIWAFGVVLFEMLTGEPLFTGDTAAEIMASAIKEEPNLDRLPATTPRAIRRLIERCLNKDPKQRLQAIGEARLVLNGPMEEAAVAASAPSRARFGVAAGVAAGVLTIALAAVSLIHFREQPAERQVLQYTLTAPEKAGDVRYMAVSPDGHYLLMLAGGEVGPQIWVRALDSLQAQPLAGTENASYPFWSPDSRSIGFFTLDKLKKIAVNGGPAQALCDAPVGRGGAWSRDGIIVFSANNGNNGLSRVPAAGGVAVAVTQTAGGGTHRWPMFLPDGRRFLYLANGGRENGIHVASLDSKDDRRLVLDESNPEYVAPTEGHASGYLLFVREQTLMAQPVDPWTLEAKGELFPVAERIQRGQANGLNLYSVSGNGMLVYQAGGGGGVGDQHIWFDRAGKEAGTVGGVVATRRSFALSPEGKRVAIERGGDNQGRSDLWITDMEHSGTETRLTFDASANSYPVWSPDGSKVAFSSNRNGGIFNIYQRAANGTGQDELLFESREPNKQPTDWSRDGRFIIFRSLGLTTNDDLWALPVTGGSQGEKKPIPLLQTPFRETQGQLSPDGRWLAYTSNESGVVQVYVQPFAPGFDKAGDKSMTGKWQISTAGGTQPRWRGDGKELFYMATDRKLMAVEVKPTAQGFERGAPQFLFDAHSSVSQNNTNWGYAPSADGKRFLIVMQPGEREKAPPITVVVNWLGGVKK
jgi:Tol biopolymer transport system component/tRNA A-37 threonylcarbamoyl transferase component Bud32